MLTYAMLQIVGVSGVIGTATTVEHVGPERHGIGSKKSTILRQARDERDMGIDRGGSKSSGQAG